MMGCYTPCLGFSGVLCNIVNWASLCSSNIPMQRQITVHLIKVADRACCSSQLVLRKWSATWKEAKLFLAFSLFCAAPQVFFIAHQWGQNGNYVFFFALCGIMHTCPCVHPFSKIYHKSLNKYCVKIFTDFYSFPSFYRAKACRVVIIKYIIEYEFRSNNILNQTNSRYLPQKRNS